MHSTIRTRLSVLVCIVTAVSVWAEAPKVTITVRPDPVYIERSADSQYLVFSFELSNSESSPLEIRGLRMRAFDKQCRLLLSDKLDSNGSRSSIEVLGPRSLDPGKPLTVFNPFQELKAAVLIDHISYEFDLAKSDGSSGTVSAEVKPVEYQQKTKLILPVAGAEVWAYEGPGFYSHHSRIDLADPFTRDVLKTHTNSQRYALDLVVVDQSGAVAHGDDNRKENWIGFDFPLVAPADGTVVQTENNQQDEMQFDPQLATKDQKVFVGNYIVIDHGDGEFSAMGHLKRGSVVVKPGDHVKQGQIIGHMGRSGMGSGLVHVHYQLQTSSDLFQSEGLPAQFEGFRQVGSKVSQTGRINPGWLVITDPARGDIP